MTIEQLLEECIDTLGNLHPAVQDFETITIPVARVRNNLIQLLMTLRQHEEKDQEKDRENDEEEI